MLAQTRARRAGFTLVELLVVIAIIGVLAGLLLAGFSSVRRSAKSAAAVTEIAQITNAVGALKAKFNTGFIPAFRPGTVDGSKFRLQKSYSPSPETYPEFVYLRQLFPQISEVDNGLPADMAGILDPNQVLTFFLTGVNQQGFSTNRAMPFTPSTGTDNRVGPFLETTPSKLFFQAAGKVPYYLDPWGTPYAYFASDPVLNTYPVNTASAAALAWPATGATHPTENAPMAPNGVRAFFSQASATAPVKFFNQKSFQVISAGPDQVFGQGGSWAPGTGDYVSNGIGADDLSNFNQGPLSQQAQ